MSPKLLGCFIALFSLISNSTGQLTVEPNFDIQAGIGLFEKAEFGIKLPSEIQDQVNEFLSDSRQGINPYDASQLDLTSVWTSPSGKTQKVNGFFYQNFRTRNEKSWSPVPTVFQWLMRWSPDEVGEWSVKVSLNSNSFQSNAESISFKCVQSNKKGHLVQDSERTNGDKYLYQKNSDKPFFAIGHNIPHGHFDELTPKYAEQHRKYIRELGENGGNFFRLELGMVTYLPSASQCSNYTPRLAQLTEMDKIVKLCDELGVHFISFRHHTEMGTGASWSKTRWGLFSYNTELGLEKRLNFFTNEEALKWQRNELRYMLARWGYSPSFSFYGYSEIEGWIHNMMEEENMSQMEALKIFIEWYKSERDFIKNDLQMDRLLFANSFSLKRIPEAAQNMSASKREAHDIFLHSDIVAYHDYGNGKKNLILHKPARAKYFQTHWDKPSLLEECGLTLPHLYCATDNNFFLGAWSSALSLDMGIGMNYWWIRGIHGNKMYELYNPICKFQERIDRRKNFISVSRMNASPNRANLSYYALINENGEEAHGFIHDASYYWRNMKAENKKVKEFLDKGKMSNPCIMSDGHELGNPLSNENPEYTKEKYHDAYTLDADKTPKTSENYGSESIKIKGLKTRGLFKKKHQFKVDYMDPRDPELKILKTETIEAKRNGTLILTLDKTTWPAAAFTINRINK